MRSLLFLGLFSLAVAGRTYFGDQVLHIHVENDAQAKAISGLGSSVDFWKPDYPEAVRAGMIVDISVPSAMVPAVKVMLQRRRVKFNVKIGDLGALLEGQRQERAARAIGSNISGGGTANYDYEVYHTYEQILQWTSDIADENPGIASRGVLGTSFEGRDIPYLVLEKDSSNPNILIDCGIHAREWIAPAYCQWLVKTLLDGNAPAGSPTLDTANYVVIPVLNPDGYAFTWNGERMWRKTRSKYAGNTCYGTDPNRNFDAGWSGPGSSPLSCSETYYGPSVESEPEVAALSNYVRAHADQFQMYVTFHSYGQVALYPYSYKAEAAPNGEDLTSFAAEGAAAAKVVDNKDYTYGAGSASMYLAAGGSDDFTYDQGVPVVYTIELRDTGTFGFALPERQIRKQCLEMDQFMGVLQNKSLSYTYTN